MEEIVDILVTTYNTKEKFLRKQIESLLKQTYTNIKIYISDDRSTDENVQKILKEYEAKDNRIKVFIQPINLGYNKNFEFLLKKSKANYIMFCDHDDVWHKDKVEKCLKKIQEEKVDMVYCNCRQIDQDGIVLQDDYFKYKNVPLINGKSKLAISRCVGIGCSQMITKEVRNKMIPFKKYVIAHDWLAAFIANEENGMTYIEEPLFDYRLHTDNVFGGRDLNSNILRWKEKYGDGYESYLKYRKDVIETAYLNGIIMCNQYCKEEENRLFILETKRYYETLLESKKINGNIKKYFHILYGKNQFKKSIREIVLFHFPIIGYIKFAKVKLKSKYRMICD